MSNEGPPIEQPEEEPVPEEQQVETPLPEQQAVEKSEIHPEVLAVA